MLSGDNGVLRQGGNAKNLTEQAQLEEEVDLAYLSYAGQIRETNDLEYYLNKIDNANVEKLAADTWCVTRGNSSVTVSDDGEKMSGKTAIWDGTSVESPEFKDFNWYIYTPAQLKFLADFVNNGNTLTSEQETLISKAGYRTSDVKMESTTMVYLMNNLDFGARAGSGSTEEQKWETTENEARKWTPIGIDNSTKKFIGTFEGNNNTIKGIYVNSIKSDNGHGLFGNSNTIQSLTIADSYIKGGTGTGGIVGVLRGTGKIENCHNKNTTIVIEGSNRIVGGIAGQVASGTEGIFNCTNEGTILGYGQTTASNTEAGGIVGRALKVEGCKNYGSVYGAGQLVGGICGALTATGSIKDCENCGQTKSEKNYIGGIVGCFLASSNKSNSNIENCYNSAKINGVSSVGGLVGYLEGSQGLGTITKCYNKGKVTGTTNVGEIVGNPTNTELNTLNNLFYLRNVNSNLSAIGNIPDDITSKIIGVDDDLTYEQFKTWITEQ